MAVRSPLVPSPNSGLMSAFSPYTDSPSSPAPYRTSGSSGRSSELPSSSLHPPPPSSPNIASSPSDIADPSPIAPSSNGTDTTDIDDAAAEIEEPTSAPQEQSASTAASKPPESELKLETKLAGDNARRARSDEDEQPDSVIHAPQGFALFSARKSPPSRRHSTPSPSQRSDITVTSPGLINTDVAENKLARSPLSPPPITTAIPPMRDWTITPRAQTRQEAEASELERVQPHRSSSLEDIPEAQDTEQVEEDTADQKNNFFHDAVGHFQETADEVSALKLALSECWTLCNTLAGLSYIHRERIFSFTGRKGDVQEQAWKSCWKLCQKLYETRDEDYATQVRPTLDLCRDFCQALFEVRQRENDVADSVLRVSFELNNHLYNTHDRTLPEAFRERTLDFYITLCHRLMKQRRRLAEETDSLLRACWSLAEMLFSLRQNKREGKPADEELLGSAVQACWELCDLFREGWTQIRPDRGTPRPSQTTFSQAFQQAKQTEVAAVAAAAAAAAEADYSDDGEFGRLNPETPTTVFEDTQQVSPDEVVVPNILVLGPEHSSIKRLQQRPGKWSSSSSSLSGYSQSSETTTSSTSTIITPAEDPHLACLKLLVVKAAMDSGFQRGSPQTLQSFVKAIPTNGFGPQPWQSQLLDQYKKLVASDPAFRSPGPARRAGAADVGRAVLWMVRSGQYVWLKDLFRLVFGFWAEEAEGRGAVVIQS
ncbi:hypothetical protein MMC08_003046 [Hypocenomyce scalaris]|nr:hypothetical protein [Hypocenomyce scalaris]